MSGVAENRGDVHPSGVREWPLPFLSEAGYTDVEIFDEHDKRWICGIAGKPTNPAVSAERI